MQYINLGSSHVFDQTWDDGVLVKYVNAFNEQANGPMQNQLAIDINATLDGNLPSEFKRIFLQDCLDIYIWTAVMFYLN